MIDLDFSWKRVPIALLCVMLFSLSTAISEAGVLPYVTPPSWSPDGSKVAVALSNSVTVRDTASNQILYMLSGHTDLVSVVAWSPDGSMIATSGRDQIIKLWDGVDGSILHTLSGHNDSVTALTWSPDGQRVVSSGLESEPSLFVWNSITGELLLTHSEGTIVDMAFSPDGHKLVLTVPTMIRIRDALTLELIAQSPNVMCCANQMYSVAWNPDGNMLVTGSINGLVTLWDPNTGQMLKQFVANTHYAPDSRDVDNLALSWVRDVTFAPDGNTVLAISGDGTLREWNAATGNLVQATQLAPLYAATWSPYTGRLAVLGPNPQEASILSSAQEFDARNVTGTLSIVVPAPSLERLHAIAQACRAPLPVEQSLSALIQSNRLDDFIAQVEALPEGTIPPACAADLLAVAGALQGVRAAS